MNIKVLLVEDDEMARKSLKKVIEKEGYSVLVACDGYEGLSLYNSEKPDVVITDVKMPRVDGIEVIQRIKEMSKTTEVILITGHGDMDMAILALRERALDYIKKPIDIDQLIFSLGRAKEKILERKKISVPSSILILEDDDITRAKLANIFQKEDYEVFVAPDGEEGLKVFSEHKIDIILTDLRMPKMDGLEFISEARKMTTDCEFIILSGFGDEASAIEAMRNGAINFIRKPIDLEQLLVSTQKAIDKLHLQRSYFYQSRELEIIRTILKKLTDEKGSSIEIPTDLEKYYVNLIFDLINTMSIAYVLFDREMKVEFAYKDFIKYYNFSPQKIDEAFFEKLHLNNIDIRKFKQNVLEMFKSTKTKIFKVPANDNVQIIVIKVFITINGGKQERGLIFIDEVEKYK